jgi:hypothetical protein
VLHIKLELLVTSENNLPKIRSHGLGESVLVGILKEILEFLFKFFSCGYFALKKHFEIPIDLNRIFYNS